MPARLLSELGAVLGCTAEAVRAGLGGGGPQTAGAMYHSPQPPTVGQQSFADAVRATLNLSAEDQAYWLREDEPTASDNPTA